MKYTVILTEEADGNIHAVIPGLPGCTVDAKTRDEALSMVCDTITTVMRRSEVVRIDIPMESTSGSLHDTTPWEWFGVFKEDSTWGELFDEIERHRNGDGT